jgi:hemerythrin-like domain-containing protein
MTVQINAKPLAGFDRPIDMLIDCHRRIEHFLDVLVRVLDRYAGHPLDAEGRQAIEVSREYFAHSAPRHTADEEQSLFPRMRSVGTAAAATCDLLDRLQQDHQTADDLHTRVDRTLGEWLTSETSLSDERLAGLRADLTALKNLYADQIRLEEDQIFPSAAKTLNSTQLREVGANPQAVPASLWRRPSRGTPGQRAAVSSHSTSRSPTI